MARGGGSPDGRTPGLNIGIFFNARRAQGGLYQYAATLVHCLRTYETRHRYVLFHAAPEPLPLSLEGERWRVVRLRNRDMWPRLGAEAALFALARLGWRRPLPVLPLYAEMRSAAGQGRTTCGGGKWVTIRTRPVRTIRTGSGGIHNDLP